MYIGKKLSVLALLWALCSCSQDVSTKIIGEVEVRTEASSWPLLLMTYNTSKYIYSVALHNPETGTQKVISEEHGFDSSLINLKHPIAVGSQVSGIICHETRTFVCKNMSDDSRLELDVLIGLGVYLNHAENALHLDMNPFDGTHVLYLERIRQGVWIVNLRTNKAKLIDTFDTDDVVQFKVDWANGLLFTTNTESISIHGIKPDSVEEYSTFYAETTFLACDSENRFLYWTDTDGSIMRRHYDHSELKLMHSMACSELTFGINPLYFHEGSVFCIQRDAANEFSELKRYTFGSTGSMVHSIDLKQDRLLNYNIYSSASDNLEEIMKQVNEICGNCSHLCLPVNETVGFVCACPYGFRLVNDFECENPAVLALLTEVPSGTHDVPRGSKYALQIHDFTTVPPATWTYAYESRPFNIVLSDTFQQLCLNFASNHSVECFTLFGDSKRIIVWTYQPEETVLKVTGNPEVGFDVYFGTEGCFRVHKTKVNLTYALVCLPVLGRQSFRNAFIDHLRQNIYFFDEDGLNTVSVESHDFSISAHPKLKSTTRSRMFYVNISTKTAVFLKGNKLQYISSFRKNTFRTRIIAEKTAQSQVLLYRQNTLLLDDSRILITETVKMAGAETLKTLNGKIYEFTLVERDTAIVTSDLSNPCEAQTECRHLCKCDKYLKNYECFCPIFLTLNGAQDCKSTVITFAFVEDQKFTLYSDNVGEVGGKLHQIRGFPALFRFGEIFLHEPNLERICVAQCRFDGCVIECSTYGKNSEFQKIATNSTKIIHMVRRHSSVTNSEDVYWISDESEAAMDRICLSVGSPVRRSSMRITCFPENAMMLNPQYVETIGALFWLKTDSAGLTPVCELRKFVVSRGHLNDTQVTDVSTFIGDCYGLAVDAIASKLYVLTWMDLHEFDISTNTGRQITMGGFKPSSSILGVFNDFVFAVGRQHDKQKAPKVVVFGPVSRTGSVLEIMNKPDDEGRFVDIHLSSSEPALKAKTTAFLCPLSCRFHCEMDTDNKPQCACPLPAPPIYGLQHQPCSEEFLDDDQDAPPGSAAFDSPSWPVLLGVVLIVAIAGACQAICWRKMKRRQDLLYRSFMEGNDAKAHSAKNESERAIHLPFTAVVPPGQLKITETCLGEGNFGQVYKGEYKNQVVAVKTVKDNLDMQVVQDFLKELKIMAYVGLHENIVEFFGAEVSEIQRGLVRVVLEFCGRGSLESVLRGYIDIVNVISSHVQGYEKVVNDGTEKEMHPLANEQDDDVDQPGNLHDLNQETSSTVPLVQLKFWAQQIASGMDYLERRNVVHGDLATRNILICDDFTAKISDFGFSKFMSQSETYRKKKPCPLPWRWASPETLSRLEFSFKADVWSYGVTVWEIFSLGAVPYPDLTWDNDFTNSIHQGLRPPKPHRMPSELYQGVLMACWNPVPANRPSFSVLASSWST